MDGRLKHKCLRSSLASATKPACNKRTVDEHAPDAGESITATLDAANGVSWSHNPQQCKW